MSKANEAPPVHDDDVIMRIDAVIEHMKKERERRVRFLAERLKIDKMRVELAASA